MTMKIPLVTGIEIDPTIDGFMADTHLFIIGIVYFYSAGDCFRRPVKRQLVMYIGKEPLMVLAVVSGLMLSLQYNRFDTIVPVHCVIGIRGSVPFDLPTDTGMVPPYTASDFSERNTCKH
jgi:hypothetical protein